MADTETRHSFGIHPAKIMITLIIMAVTVLFLAFSASYIFSRIQSNLNPVKVPLLFFINTLFIMGSSYSIEKSIKLYQSEKTEKYKHALVITLLLTLFFLIGQIYAWRMLFLQNTGMIGDNSTSYLYVLSGVHFTHVIGGLPFLISFYIKAIRKLKGPVENLIYYADEAIFMRLKVLRIYWHFVDLLWIYLIIFFAANSLL